ncbi:hypothetical protein LguiB_013614 [Lonicera macranthoides]
MPKTINSWTILKKIDHHFSNFDKMVKSILAWRKLIMKESILENLRFESAHPPT